MKILAYFFTSLEKKLYIACHNGDTETVKELLKHSKIDVNKGHIGKTKNQFETPLYIACHNKHTETVKELLKHPNLDVNKGLERKNTEFITSLAIACVKRQTEIVKELLKHPNIDVNKGLGKKKTSQFSTPLFLACEGGLAEIVKELLKHPNIDGNKGYVNKKTGHFETPLYIACQGVYIASLRKQTETVKLLLEHGANISQRGIVSDQKQIEKYVTIISSFYQSKEKVSFIEKMFTDETQKKMINFLFKTIFTRAMYKILNEENIDIEKTEFYALYKNQKCKRKLEQILDIDITDAHIDMLKKDLYWKKLQKHKQFCLSKSYFKELDKKLKYSSSRGKVYTTAKIVCLH